MTRISNNATSHAKVRSQPRRFFGGGEAIEVFVIKSKPNHLRPRRVRDTFFPVRKGARLLDKAVIETFKSKSAQLLRRHAHPTAPLNLILRTDAQFHLSIVSGTNILVA
jgi:hypothetical protein